MQVYGDHSCKVAGGEFLRGVVARLRALAGTERGLAWHSRCVALLIELGSLLQGVADRELAERGCDERTATQQALMASLVSLARSIRLSWRSGFEQQVCTDLGDLRGLELPGELVLKRPEGYAFYALYPEAYLAAAATVPCGSVVVGLRSIGASLAAVVAEASGAEEVLTVRPEGHPFDRRVTAGPSIEALVEARAERHFVIVDEGPGMSGSSFGGAADWLESLGVARERIGFMPSHPGGPGLQAGEQHLRRWAAASRRVADFDRAVLAARDRCSLPGWFASITGRPTGPLLDLSAGAWASGAPVPVAPAREARKFLVDSERGRFRLKFIGLVGAADAKLARAEALHRAGFGLEPLACRHGFLIEHEVAASRARHVPLKRLGDYLAFRSSHFPAQRQGASLAELVAAAASNIAEVKPRLDMGPITRWYATRAEELQANCRPVHVDARLHLWEWLVFDGKLIKTDALDHSEAHDLVGCQDIAWDVAGAIVEHGLRTEQAARLVERVMRGRRWRHELTRLMTFCYLGFQLGWWSFSSTAAGLERSRWYAGRAAALVRRFNTTNRLSEGVPAVL